MKEAMTTKNTKQDTQKYSVKKESEIRKVGFSFIAILLISHFSPLTSHVIKNVFADTISDPNYSIDVGNIDTNPQPTPRPQVLGTTNVQVKEFTTGPNYTINTAKDSFSIGLSQNTIDYGILSSTNPVIRTSGITFSNPQLGAEILTYENHPLMSSMNDLIQNTTCDNGSCYPQIAAAWNNTLTYGFGYRCDSTDPTACDSQFSTSNYYKQYPDSSKAQLPEVILMSKTAGPDTKANVTYKVNISGTQKTGGYYNSITYLAIPNF